jgi:site-specific recombinase XerD
VASQKGFVVPATAISAPIIASLLPSWRRSLEAANRSPRTIRRYTDDTALFARYLSDNKLAEAVDTITREHVEMFVRWQVRNYAPASAATRFRSLAQFWKWAIDEGEVKASPMARMSEPQVPDVPIPVIPEDEIAKLLATCEGRAPFMDRRDAAIMLVLIDAGLRASELTGVEVADVDLDRGLIRVLHAKGRRARNVPIGTRTVKALDRYLRARAAHPSAELPAFFLGRGGAVTASGLRQILEVRCRAAKVPMRSPHKWRHTSAHLALSAGASEGDAMTIYGWKSRQMLGRYGAVMAEDRAIAAHKKHFGPADRLGQQR